jgi:glycosyltransferase involved in cell wall biosynthesis
MAATQKRETDPGAPLISVVTCCYNQGAYLEDNIRSVLDQHYEPFEHIVVDDGSTDTTRAVCERYPHVRYIYQDNAGQSAALNRGFREAKGEIIAWLNSDDYYPPDIFDAIARAIDPSDNHCIVAGKADAVDADGRFLWRMENGTVTFMRLLFHPDIYRHGGRVNMPCQPAVFFHRTVPDRLGYLDTGLKYAMDYDYWLRALTAGFRFHYIPKVFALYRFHPTSHSSRGFDTFLPEWQEVSDRHYAGLPPLQKMAARIWRAYGMLESGIYRRRQEKIRRVNPARPAVMTNAPSMAACTSKPLATVILPVYNSERFLGRTLDSIFAQTYPHFELLAVDDGSTDGSAQILEEYAGRFSDRMRILRHPDNKNRGVSAARNLAWENGCGTYTAFIDADDCWHPEKLASQVALMETHPDTGLCFTQARLLRDAEDISYLHRQDTIGRIDADDTRSTFWQLVTGSLQCAFSSVMVRNEAVMAKAPFDLNLPYQSEDRIFLCKMAAGTSFTGLEQTLADYRIHDDNFTARIVRNGQAAQVFLDLQLRLMRWFIREKHNRPFARLIVRHAVSVTFLQTVMAALLEPANTGIVIRAWLSIARFLPLSAIRLAYNAMRYVCRDRFTNRYRYPHETRMRLGLLLPYLAKRGYASLKLYGAGAHTCRLMELTDFKPLAVTGILDDFSGQDRIGDIPVIPADRFHQSAANEAILISSDTSQRRLYRQARQHGWKHVFRLY